MISSTMVFNVAKIASVRASSTIALTKSLRVAGPLGFVMENPHQYAKVYEGFYNFSKVCCPTDFALNIST